MRSLCASRGDVYFKIDVTLEGDSLTSGFTTRGMTVYVVIVH
jgi:hypothetical protein